MTIKVGDRLPEGTLTEYIEVEGQGCSLGPNAFKVSDLVKGKKIVIFAVPGAFTTTCSQKHLPGFVRLADEIKAKGVDEIWCVSVNDAFVMRAWGKEHNVTGKIRMMADGAALWTKALGLDMDMTERGYGIRSKRYAAIVEDGVVKSLEVEAPGVFEVSSAEAVLSRL